MTDNAKELLALDVNDLTQEIRRVVRSVRRLSSGMDEANTALRQLAHAMNITSVEPRPSEREALERLLTTAKLLQQNAEGCATNHYGHDCELNGLPGWLIDTQKDILAAQESLSAAPGEPCAWVKRLADNWRGRRDSLTGDSVRDSCADELEKVAACHATPQPAAGRSNDKRNIIQDAIIRCPSFSDLHRAPDLCAYDLADDIIKALRREAPAPADLSYVSQLIAENNELKDQLAARPDSAEARLREAVEDAIDTLESMDLHVDNPLYERLVKALSPPSGGDEAKESEGRGLSSLPSGESDHSVTTGCRPSEPSPPADRREIVAWFKDRIDKYETQLNATGQADLAHLLRRDTQIILAALDGGR